MCHIASEDLESCFFGCRTSLSTECLSVASLSYACDFRELASVFCCDWASYLIFLSVFEPCSQASDSAVLILSSSALDLVDSQQELLWICVSFLSQALCAACQEVYSDLGCLGWGLNLWLATVLHCCPLKNVCPE